MHTVPTTTNTINTVPTTTNTTNTVPTTTNTTKTVPIWERWKSSIVDKTMQTISHKKGPLSVVIGGLKRSITHHAHENGISFAWQTRFHDRIIRNQYEMNRIATYIEQNISKW